mmetsp:Transcript_6040/g.10906  ORF Transcript_6040/g.10906 Transcript_6040/m.10906 type:complete len:278 (-) Transcript_6040:212-1045(-)
MAAREAKLVAAEEALVSRRAELERAAASRISEAEAAVRRLQLECEHQLDLERHRSEELARGNAALEAKLRTAENRADAVEAAFQEYREGQRQSSEAVLAAELHEARMALREAQDRAREAGDAKERYKSRMLALARDLSALQRARAADQAALMSSRLVKMDGATTGLMAGGQVLAARAQASELAVLRSQLEQLRLTLGPVAAAAAPATGLAEKENTDPSSSMPSGGRPGKKLSGAVTAEVERLRAERSGLVASGLYVEGDPLVVEIDRQIDGLLQQGQ